MTVVTQIADSRTVRKAVAGKRMNRSEAQELTDRIRNTAGMLWQMVSEAHDRQAWRALGYTAWKSYAEEELQMSESRSYQLVDVGRVMRAIAEVAGTAEVMSAVTITSRDAAKIKPHLSTFKRELKDALRLELPIVDAVAEALHELPTAEPKTRGPRTPKVIEGEVVVLAESQADAELLAALTGPARKEAKAVPVPTFSTVEPITQSMLPRGKKVCTACGGHGYL